MTEREEQEAGSDMRRLGCHAGKTNRHFNQPGRIEGKAYPGRRDETRECLPDDEAGRPSSNDAREACSRELAVVGRLGEIL